MGSWRRARQATGGRTQVEVGRHVWLLMALALLVGACIRGQQPDTSRPLLEFPTTLPGAGVTSLPPIPDQRLTYGFRPGQRLVYDLTLTVATQVAVNQDSSVDLATDLGIVPLDGAVDMSGRLVQTALEGPEPGTHEIVVEVILDRATVRGTEAGTPDRTLTGEEASQAAFGSSGPIVVSVIVDDAGERASAAGRVDAFNPLAADALPAFDPVQRVGPIFPRSSVGVGDTWEVVAPEGAGPIVVEATNEIVAQDIWESAAVLVISEERRSEATIVSLDELIGERSADASTAIGSPPDSDLRQMAALLENRDLTLDFSFDETVGSSRFLFDPDAGMVVSETSTGAVSYLVRVTGGDEQVEAAFRVQMDVESELVEAGDATQAQIDATLGAFRPDPLDVALAPLAGLGAYVFDDIASDRYESYVERLAVLGDEFFEAVAPVRALSVVDEGEAAVLSFAITGWFRGDPTMAPGAAGFLADAHDTEVGEVQIGDATAYRLRLDDEEWLFWASNTHLLLVIGEANVAERVLFDVITAATLSYLWQPGDCLDLGGAYPQVTPHAPFGRLALAHCADSHTHEVIHSESLEHGADAPYPREELIVRRDLACGKAFFDYVGVLDAETAVDLVAYLPDRAEWREGDRYIACVIFLSDPLGEVAITGRLAGAGRANPLEFSVGDCIPELGQRPPVPCEDVHRTEVIGFGTHSAGPGEPFPSLPVLEEFTQETCRALLDAYGVQPGNADVGTFSIGLDAFTWSQGVREFACLAQPERQGPPLLIAGSLTGEWTAFDLSGV